MDRHSTDGTSKQRSVKRFRKNDAFLIALILVVALIFRFTSLTRQTGAFVSVYSDGALFGEYPLSETLEIEVVNSSGNVNIVEISGGTASVRHADCRDGICVRMGGISKAGETVVCIPNRLSIRIEGTELDGIAQ